MTPEAKVGNAHPIGIGLRRVLGVVKDKDVAAGGLGGNDAGVLRHVASSVYFALVVDLDLDLNFSGHAAEPAKLTLLVVVVRRVKLGILVWQLNRSNELNK